MLKNPQEMVKLVRISSTEGDSDDGRAQSAAPSLGALPSAAEPVRRQRRSIPALQNTIEPARVQVAAAGQRRSVPPLQHTIELAGVQMATAGQHRSVPLAQNITEPAGVQMAAAGQGVPPNALNNALEMLEHGIRNDDGEDRSGWISALTLLVLGDHANSRVWRLRLLAVVVMGWGLSLFCIYLALGIHREYNINDVFLYSLPALIATSIGFAILIVSVSIAPNGWILIAFLFGLFSLVMLIVATTFPPT